VEVRRVVLDTNAYTALRRGDERVLDALAAADRVYVPIFVFGELLHGFKLGRKELANRRRLEAFVRKPSVRALNTSSETAEVFATLKSGLQKQGTPIPDNDLWIAAQCLETGSTLISFDRHFECVGGLRVWLYEDPA
jgi:tRNA(fMet)-specific endonuclease VapC